jgi:hypothetical protein
MRWPMCVWICVAPARGTRKHQRGPGASGTVIEPEITVRCIFGFGIGFLILHHSLRAAISHQRGACDPMRWPMCVWICVAPARGTAEPQRGPGASGTVIEPEITVRCIFGFGIGILILHHSLRAAIRHQCGAWDPMRCHMSVWICVAPARGTGERQRGPGASGSVIEPEITVRCIFGLGIGILILHHSLRAAISH